MNYNNWKFWACGIAIVAVGMIVSELVQDKLMSMMYKGQEEA